MLARHLLERLSDTTIERLAVFDPLPVFDGAAIEGRYALIAGEAVGGSAADDWERIAELVTHFLSFDAWLISVPMWNFGIPYRLKQYIDLLTQPNLTFGVGQDGSVVGHAAGRTAIIIASGALDTSKGGALAHADHQVAYLETWLNFIGVTDINIVRIQPTYGSPDVVEAAMERAYADAAALARALSRPARV